MKKRTFLKLSSAAITAAMLPPLPDWAQEGQLTNWAGNFTYGTNHLVSPESMREIVSTIKGSSRIKALGTRHCFNGIADSTYGFISLLQVEEDPVIDKVSQLVSVPAGTRYGTLASYLNGNGYALHNLASLPHISVAGSCATGTHGSGSTNGNLATAVLGMEILTAAGERVEISSTKNAELLKALVVHLGAAGIVTKLVLAIQPTFQVSQTVYENLRMDVLEHHFEDIMSAGYSVSLFTDWQKGLCSEVWVKRRISGSTLEKAPSDFYGASPATANVHPIISLSAENCTEQMGIPGPWHERLPHFKMGFTPSSGKELQTEYFVPREHSYEAIKAVETLRDEIIPHLLISEIRTVAADDLWMSPCYNRASTTIHFTWQPDWTNVRRLLPRIEEKLAPFRARPHWGKLFSMPPGQLAGLYPKLKEFRDLVRQFDPNGKFLNEFLSKNIMSA
jgi:xylitol oxidase